LHEAAALSWRTEKHRQGRSGDMKAQTTTSTEGHPRSRYAELKQMLLSRQRELQAEVKGKIRDAREEGIWGAKQSEVLDAVESSEADIQDDIEFALIQMKSETLNRVNDALARLEQGDYGNCFECGEEIAEKRLRALPFAVRCKDCEEAREVAAQRERQAAARRGSASLFMDM
jgi:DnaK suppressor protein